MNLAASSAHKCLHVNDGDGMPRVPRQTKPFGLGLIAPALLLSAWLATPPVFAQAPSRSNAADNSWCGDGSSLTFAQRISGCRIILALERMITSARVVAHVWRGQFYAEQREYGSALADFNAAAAIADYNAALSINPKMAESLFGRGIAKTKQGDAEGGRVDIEAAKAITADIAAKFVSWGIAD